METFFCFGNLIFYAIHYLLCGIVLFSDRKGFIWDECCMQLIFSLSHTHTVVRIDWGNRENWKRKQMIDTNFQFHLPNHFQLWFVLNIFCALYTASVRFKCVCGMIWWFFAIKYVPIALSKHWRWVLGSSCWRASIFARTFRDWPLE